MREQNLQKGQIRLEYRTIVLIFLMHLLTENINFWLIYNAMKFPHFSENIQIKLY